MDVHFLSAEDMQIFYSSIHLCISLVVFVVCLLQTRYETSLTANERILKY